jgi:hypothetical protein
VPHDQLPALETIPVPVALVRRVRWLLTTSASLPEERVAAIEALDLVLRDAGYGYSDTGR